MADGIMGKDEFQLSNVNKDRSAHTLALASTIKSISLIS